MHENSPEKLAAYKLILPFAGVTIGLVTLEVILRTAFLPLDTLSAGAQPTSDPRGYILKPGARLTFRGMYEELRPAVTWQFNNQGIRSADTSSYPPHSRKYRICILGDSEAFGWAVNFEQALPRRLEVLDTSLEVIDLGVPGYNIDNIAEHMAQMCPLLHPDLVVYLVNPNDLDPPITYTSLLIDLEIVRRIAFLFMREDDPAVLAARHTRERIEHFREHFYDMRKLARSNGPEICVAAIDSGVPPRDVFREVSFIDVSEIFRTDTRTDIHLSANGHARLAALLQGFIAEIRRRKKDDVAQFSVLTSVSR